MAGGALGGGDEQRRRGAGTQGGERSDGARLGGVARGRRGGVRIDVVKLPGLDAALA